MVLPQTKKIVFGVIVTTFVLFLLSRFFGNDKEYSPEEINSLLQNKDQNIVTIKKVELTAQNLIRPYIDTTTYKVKNWELKGNTIVKSNDFIRLTSDNKHQVGSMFATTPVQAASFEMELTFHIHAKEALKADGMAIWFIDKKSEIGDVFGAENYFKGLGIMIDTFKNGKRGNFPYVNIMLGNGQLEYDKAMDGYDTRLAGCVAHLITNPKQGYTKARIVYIKDGYFSLDFKYSANDHWTNCVTLNDVILPSIKYLGFSAETGDLSENVDIIESRIFALYKPDGYFIENIEELETLISNQDIARQNQVDATSNTHKPSGKTRKSIKRLQKAEERIKKQTKQRNKQQYGHEDHNIFTYHFGKFLTLIKYFIYISLLVLILWFGFIVQRVMKQRKKSKTAGLLD